MAWVYLIAAGLFEIGWPVGIKLAQGQQYKYAGVVIAIVCMGISGFLLFLAQKQISLGTSYAVWTGIGAAGTFVVGIIFFQDAASLGKYLGVLMIISGVVVLKLSH